MEQPEGDARCGGPIEAQVRADIEALVSEHPMGEALAEMAFALARRLEASDTKDLAYAGINKELRETLGDLVSMKAGDDDDLAAALSMPTQIRDSAES